MEKKSKLMNAIFYFGIGALYVYALSASLIKIILPEMIQPGMLLMMALAALALYYLVFYNKYTVIASFVLCCLVAIVQYRAFLRTDKELQKFIDTAYGAVMFIRGFFPFDESYSPFIIGSVVMLFAFITAVGLHVVFQFYFLSLLGFIVFAFTGTLNGMDTEVNFLIFLFCFFVLLMKKLNLIALGKKGVNYKFTLGIIPVSLAIVIFIGFIPVPERGEHNERIQAVFLDSTIYGELDNLIYESFHPKYFSFKSTGFSRWDDRLGGKVATSNREAMRVTAEESTYLRGVTKNIYTGDSWTDNTAKQEDSILVQVASDEELKKFILKNWLTEQNSWVNSGNDGIIHTPSWKDVLLRFMDFSMDSDSIVAQRTMEVDIGENRLMTIFQPPLPLNITFSQDVTLRQKENGDLYVDKLLGKSTRYTITYTSIDYNNEIVKNLLREYTKKTKKQFDEYSSYNEKVYTQYANLPSELPQRVYDLAYELVESCTNDYDRMKALEEYLAVFPYTLAPKNVPLNRDFVDYFLFEGKEGYCSYYATALAVMARCVGIPTRYLEGYVMPAKNDNYVYSITDFQAHSWVEAYFEGIGWVPFEPTPPYNYVLYEKPPESVQSIFSSDMLSMNQYEAYMESFDFYTPPESIGSTFTQAQTSIHEEEEEQQGWHTPLKIGMAILSLMLVLLLFVGYRKWRFKRLLLRIRKLDNKEATIWYFRSILKVAKAYRYPILPNETALIYAERLGKRFALVNETIFMRHLAKIFSDAVYGMIPVTDENCRLMETAYLEMLGMLQMYRMRREVYVVRKYILNQF